MHRGRQQNFQIPYNKKDSQDYNFGARHIFPFANAVEQHNRNIFHQMQEDKVTIQAEDAVCGNPNEGEWIR